MLLPAEPLPPYSLLPAHLTLSLSLSRRESLVSGDDTRHGVSFRARAKINLVDLQAARRVRRAPSSSPSFPPDRFHLQYIEGEKVNDDTDSDEEVGKKQEKFPRNVLSSI